MLTVLIVALTFGMPLWAAPAQASLPVTIDPFKIEERRGDVTVWLVEDDGIRTPGSPFIEEYCIKDRLVCVGPYQLPSYLLVPGKFGVATSLDHLNASLEWNQSRTISHGPYNVDLPLLGRIPFCTWGCQVPHYANSTINATITLGVYAGSYQLQRTVDFGLNSTSPQATRLELMP